jgi:hypothetical protein
MSDGEDFSPTTLSKINVGGSGILPIFFSGDIAEHTTVGSKIVQYLLFKNLTNLKLFWVLNADSKLLPLRPNDCNKRLNFLNWL